MSKACALCLRRFRGFAPKYPTTFEKVDETFVFLHFLKYPLWTLPGREACPRHTPYVPASSSRRSSRAFDTRKPSGVNRRDWGDIRIRWGGQVLAFSSRRRKARSPAGPNLSPQPASLSPSVRRRRSMAYYGKDPPGPSSAGADPARKPSRSRGK